MPDSRGVDGEIARLHSPSRAEFEAFARTAQPAVIEGLVAGWRCFETWTDDYLRRRLAGRKFLVSVSDDGLFGIFSSRMLDADSLLHLSFAEFLQRVRAHGDPGADGPVHYLQQKPIAQSFPELADDVEYATFIDRDAVVQVNLWIGQRKSRIPLHYDTFDNLLAQVRGAKSIQLFAPWRTPDMYPGLDGAEFASQVDPQQPDYDRFPRFRSVRSDFELALREGECLYLPPFWWHSVRAEVNANISINYWYDTAFGDARAPFAAARDLMRLAVGQLGRLPPAQKRQALCDAQRWLDALDIERAGVG